MAGMGNNLNYLLVIFAICLAAFFFFGIRRPERLFNSFLLLFKLLFAVPTVSSLFNGGGAQIAVVLAFTIIAATLLVPLMLIWNGLVMLRRESGRLANLLSLLLGVAVGAGEIALIVSVLRGFSYSLWGVGVRLLGLSVFYFSLLLLAFVLYSLVLPLLSRRKPADTILVHGCALIRGDVVSRILANRLDLALELYRVSGEKALLVVSGGQGDDETVSEAEAMARYLKEKGVPEERILLEDQSRSTEENLVNSLSLLAGRGGAGRLALVTSGYHLYRCYWIAHSLGLRCRGYGAKVAAYYWPSAVVREFAAVYTRSVNLICALLGYALFVLLPVFFSLLPLLQQAA